MNLEYVESNNFSKVFSSCYKPSVSRSIFKPSQRSRHLFKSKRLEDPQAVIRKPTLFYSRRQGTWSLEDWRGGELLLYFSRWVKYRIDQQRVRTKCHLSLSPVFQRVRMKCHSSPSPVFLTNDSSRFSTTGIFIILNIFGCFLWIFLYCWDIWSLLIRDKDKKNHFNQKIKTLDLQTSLTFPYVFRHFS